MSLTIPTTAAPEQMGADAEAIVPHNSANQGPFRKIYVGGTGTITLVTLGGNVVLFTAVPAGFMLEIGCTRVNSTGTTATLMVGIT